MMTKSCPALFASNCIWPRVAEMAENMVSISNMNQWMFKWPRTDWSIATVPLVSFVAHSGAAQMGSFSGAVAAFCCGISTMRVMAIGKTARSANAITTAINSITVSTYRCCTLTPAFSVQFRMNFHQLRVYQQCHFHFHLTHFTPFKFKCSATGMDRRRTINHFQTENSVPPIANISSGRCRFL